MCHHVHVGGLHTSAWIPPLLGVYYAAAGGLIVAADSLSDDRTQNGGGPTCSDGRP